MAGSLNRLWRGALALVVVLACVPWTVVPSAAAQDAAPQKTVNLEFIVDSSGSMAAQTDTGALRMDAAKNVLNEVIDQIPVVEGVNVGMRVYGHKGNNTDAGKAESCAASDLLVPMQGVNPEALHAQVNALAPTGWTPIGQSLQMAQADFPAASDTVSNVIILVTDGLESCDWDPAAIAGQLLASPQKIITHVIGFGTKPEEQAILNAITQSSGGQLMGSANAGSLMSSIFAILEDLDVVEKSGDGAASNSAVKVGREGRVQDYKLNVTSVEGDATAKVLERHPEINPPTEGKVYTTATLTITMEGDATGKVMDDLQFEALAKDGTQYSSADNSCGFAPTAANGIADLGKGQSAEIEVCWQVDKANADSLVMAVVAKKNPQAPPTWFQLSDAVAPDAPALEIDRSKIVVPEGAVTDVTSDARDASMFDRGYGATPGQAMAFGTYEFAVNEYVPDASAEVQGTVLPGRQFALVRLTITNVGTAPANPATDLTFKAVGDGNLMQSTDVHACGTVANGIDTLKELAPGESVTVNVCWQVRATDAASLEMYIQWTAKPAEPAAWFQLGS